MAQTLKHSPRFPGCLPPAVVSDSGCTEQQHSALAKDIGYGVRLPESQARDSVLREELTGLEAVQSSNNTIHPGEEAVTIDFLSGGIQWVNI